MIAGACVVICAIAEMIILICAPVAVVIEFIVREVRRKDDSHNKD